MALSHKVTRLLNNNPKMHLPRVGPAKAVRAAIIVLICTVLLLTFRLSSNQPRQPSIYEYTDGRTSPWHDWREKNESSRSDEVAFLDHLVRTYGLTHEIPWYGRRIRANPSANGRLSMSDVPLQFMPNDFTRARVDDEGLDLRAERSIKLPVTKSPRGHQVDASALLFGISTTYSRLIYADNSLVHDWARWLTDGKGNSNGGSLVLTLHKASHDEVEQAESVLRSIGIDATVLQSADDGDSTSRYFELVHLLKKYSEAFGADEGRKKKYLALADIDVFFPSMSKLVERLSKFSPSKEYYIGAPSDRSDWIIENNQTFTCGGGAVFLTLPMAEKVSQLSCLEPTASQEQDSTTSVQWDSSLYTCITNHTTAPIHVLPSYHHPTDDLIYGDHRLSNEGYGSGLQPLTLHHYKTWQRFDAGKGHLVASVCGEDCFLQRFRFEDDWILVNGYAISHFPDGVDALPLVPTPSENRRHLKDYLYDHHRRETSSRMVPASRLVIDTPDRPNYMKVVAWRGRRRVWRLLDARVVPGRGDGEVEVWQAYVKRREGGNWYGDADRRVTVHAEEEKTDVDSVIVLIWEG